MKFKINDEVRSVQTGLVGVVIATDYMYRVKNGDIQETKLYRVQWKNSNEKPQWMHEYQLAHTSEELMSEDQYITELITLELLIDSALKKGNKNAFKQYAKQRNKILEEMKIRGFVKFNK